MLTQEELAESLERKVGLIISEIMEGDDYRFMEAQFSNWYFTYDEEKGEFFSVRKDKHDSSEMKINCNLSVVKSVIRELEAE